MIVLSGLGALSALAVVSVRGGMKTQSGDRFHGLATYAAESGGAVAMDFLRKNVEIRDEIETGAFENEEAR